MLSVAQPSHVCSDAHKHSWNLACNLTRCLGMQARKQCTVVPGVQSHMLPWHPGAQAMDCGTWRASTDGVSQGYLVAAHVVERLGHSCHCLGGHRALLGAGNGARHVAGLHHCRAAPGLPPPWRLPTGRRRERRRKRVKGCRRSCLDVTCEVYAHGPVLQ